MPFEGEKFKEGLTQKPEEEKKEEQEEKTPEIVAEKGEIELIPEYQKIENVLVEEVGSGDPDFEKAKEVHVEIGETKKEIKERLERGIIEENWWFQNEWKEKGIPKEQLEITTGDHKLNVNNFGEVLTDRHIMELEKVIKEFSQIKNGEFLDKVEYILINNIKKENPYSGEEQMGFSHPSAKAIELNPKGVEFSSHRIDKTSSFEGTLIHEFSHNVADEVINEWNEKFGWEFVENPTEKFPNGELKWWRNKIPEKCINSYARLSPDEDIAESMVAALRNPEALDPERLQFLKEALLLDKIDINKASKINIKKRGGKDIKLPELESPLKYKVIEHEKTKEKKPVETEIEQPAGQPPIEGIKIETKEPVGEKRPETATEQNPEQIVTAKQKTEKEWVFNPKIGEFSFEDVEAAERRIDNLGKLMEGADFYWQLDGGLNAPIYNGEYYRRHKDIEISVGNEDIKKIYSLVEQKGYHIFVKSTSHENPKKLLPEDLENFDVKGEYILSDREKHKGHPKTEIELHIQEKNEKGNQIVDGVEIPKKYFENLPKYKTASDYEVNLSCPLVAAFHKIKMERGDPFESLESKLEDPKKSYDIKDLKILGKVLSDKDMEVLKILVTEHKDKMQDKIEEAFEEIFNSLDLKAPASEIRKVFEEKIGIEKSKEEVKEKYREIIEKMVSYIDKNRGLNFDDFNLKFQEVTNLEAFLSKPEKKIEIMKKERVSKKNLERKNEIGNLLTEEERFRYENYPDEQKLKEKISKLANKIQGESQKIKEDIQKGKITEKEAKSILEKKFDNTLLGEYLPDHIEELIDIAFDSKSDKDYHEKLQKKYGVEDTVKIMKRIEEKFLESRKKEKEKPEYLKIEGEKIYKTEYVDKLDKVLEKKFKTGEKNEKGEAKEIVLKDTVEEHLKIFRTPEFSKLSKEQKAGIQKQFVKDLTEMINKIPDSGIASWSFYFKRALKTGEMNCAACASLNGLILENSKKTTELEKIEFGLPYGHAMNIVTFSNGQIYYVDPRNNVFENLRRNIKIEYKNGLKVYKIKELKGGMYSKIIPTLPVKEGVIGCYVDNLHSTLNSAENKFPESLKMGRTVKELKKIQKEAQKICQEKGLNNKSYEQLKKIKEFFNKKVFKYQESREFKTEIKRMQEFRAFTKDLEPFFKLFTENKEIKREIMAKKNKITRFLLYGTVKPTLENKKAEKEFRKFYQKQRKLRESNFVQYQEFIKQVITGLKTIR